MGSVKHLLKRQEGGPGQDRVTCVDCVKALIKRQECGPEQDGETCVDLFSKSTYSKGRKVVLGRMERQLLMLSVKAPTQKAGRWSWAGWRDRC